MHGHNAIHSLSITASQFQRNMTGWILSRFGSLILPVIGPCFRGCYVSTLTFSAFPLLPRHRLSSLLLNPQIKANKRKMDSVSEKSPNPPADNVDVENGAHEMVSCLVLFFALIFSSHFVAVCLPHFLRVTDCWCNDCHWFGWACHD